MRESHRSYARSSFAASALALAFVLVQGPALAQSPGEGPGDRRVHAQEPVGGADELEATIARLELQNSTRRWFVVVTDEDERPWAIAERVATQWDKKPGETWSPRTSALAVVSRPRGKISLRVPPRERDELGLSPLELDEKLAEIFEASARPSGRADRKEHTV